MNILVTGSKGFVGKNLVATLKNIRDLKDKTRPNIKIENVFEYDIDSTLESLDEYCKEADFVFNLAGINRPKDKNEYMKGNRDFGEILLNYLQKHNNKCPIMLSSSIQASLSGRFTNSEYGISKLAGEELLFKYSKLNNVKVLVYRFPNLFGKWCLPNYNSVVATFCYNIANDLSITINDRSTVLELLYIDDLINEMLDALESKEHRCEYMGLEVLPKSDGKYSYVPITHRITLGEIADYLYEFKEQPKTLLIPSISKNSFKKKLYSTYLSYLPKEKIAYDLKMNVDERGSFTELLKSINIGQVSVNVSKPGVVKGNHWHNTKWEFFMVVSGHALIQERNIYSDEVINIEVDGNHMKAVHMLPGYTHNIINLSKTDNLVTVMWANELFDKEHPDTFFEVVENNGKEL